MTKSLAKTQIDNAFKYKHAVEGAFLALAKTLYEIHSQTLWKGYYGSYGEFLEDLGVSEGHASRLRSIYEKFILQLSFPEERLKELGQKKLYAILPECTDAVTTKKTIEAIEGLSVKDVERRKKELRVGAHNCIPGEIIQMSTCRKCGKLMRV